MLKYLIVLLSDLSPSVCHYQNGQTKQRLISPEILRKAVTMAMQQNLSVQVVWPNHTVPEEVKAELTRYDHINIAPVALTTDAEVLIAESVSDLLFIPNNANVVLRLSLTELQNEIENVETALSKMERLNIVLTDVDKLGDKEFDLYNNLLNRLSSKVKDEYRNKHSIQVGCLTDRIMLSRMNNCNAGFEGITLAPDGCFYVCPAFYFNGDDPIGDVEKGVCISNPQLYRLDHAPLCRNCEAYQCRRCAWLNKKITHEVNTPSHEQCVMAHIERNASMRLLESIRELGEFMPEKKVEAIDYLDPFDKISNNI